MNIQSILIIIIIIIKLGGGFDEKLHLSTFEYLTFNENYETRKF